MATWSSTSAPDLAGSSIRWPAWFDRPVVAVELSEAMRTEARAAGTADRFSYVGGRAEQIPLADATVAVAWLSTVVHQFDDLAAAARELRRVVRPGGLVLIRGFFADLGFSGLFELFPGIERAAATFPRTDDVVEVFEHAGWRLEQIVDVPERWTFELEPWTDRVRSIRHTDSALRPLTDDEVEAGHRGGCTPATPASTARSSARAPSASSCSAADHR